MKKDAGWLFPKCRLTLILFFLLSISGTRAQDMARLDTIDISKVPLSKNLRKCSLWYTDVSHDIPPARFPGLVKDTIPGAYLRKIPGSLVPKAVYLKFVVQNSNDTAIGCYFLPGFYFKGIELYRLDAEGNIRKLPHESGDPLGYRKIMIPPKQTTTYFAHLQFLKTSVNSLNPSLIRDYYQESFAARTQNLTKENNTITFILCGIMLMMIFYSIAVYFLNGNIEFLYYSGYAFSLGVMLFLKSYLFRAPSQLNYIFEGYLDFIIQSVGTFVYVAFLRKFINTRSDFPLLHKVLYLEQVLTVFGTLLFSYLYFFSDFYILQEWVKNLTKYMWAICMIFFVIYAINKKNRLLNYLSTGIFCLLIGSLISLYFIQNSGTFRSLPPIFSNALIYYELGIVADLVLFLVALAYKNRTDIVNKTKEGERLKLQNERQEFEKQVAVLSAKQEERTRISADMHDELGSGVTAIRLMSEIVKSKMKEHTLPEIHKISNSANDLINKMNTLIWTMKSENDSLESLITYIRAYALEFFENTSIDCVVNIPYSIPQVELSGEKRRSIFLSVKESLNNVLKHSKAGKVMISYLISEKLVILILDNGVGIDLQNLRPFSNGLDNIKKRIEGIDGVYRIENLNGTGTRTTMELRL
ncbi:MAG TPA: 7TM diverse intracellular signaling domain-containing protein [Chitinophagaceae bacterium]|nr:7TM diverse intracellular signaling domain-containing protein [Chitinophagaceae bacterium]